MTKGQLKNMSFSTKVYLHFNGGPTFTGKTNLPPDHPDLLKGIWGEAAFTTGMAGYQETITDPSFLGQHIIFSYPHIGNYPPDPRALQSLRTHATSIMASHFSPNPFFHELDVPLITPSDTRALVKFLASAKTSPVSVINLSPLAPPQEEFLGQKTFCDQLHRVSHGEDQVLIPGENPIVVINYGIKKAILDGLKKLNFPLVMVNHLTTFDHIHKYRPRLVFLSNGPGDPSSYTFQIEVLQKIITAGYPLRAICLGHQLTALALGAKTHALPFGHRGCNHPVLNHLEGKVLITSQNHGYTIDAESFARISGENPFGKTLFVQFTSLFDQSIEGFTSTDHSIKTVQFHPEAAPGPSDAAFFFQEVGDYLEGQGQGQGKRTLKDISLSQLVPAIDLKKEKPKISIPYKKILVIGSGPIRIGQASEFDYSGTQACRALKEQGLEVVLVNSNPATIMTDRSLAHRTYIEPITLPVVKQIIEKERVDAILSTMGGQTALNLCLELEQEGYLQDQGITLLGANSQTIMKTENRELFSSELAKLGYKTGQRIQVFTREEALNVAKETLGYPNIIRRNFALGGQGAQIIQNQEEMLQLLNQETKFPLTLEKSLHGHKEIELEIMIDREQNGVVICSIENVDPCGVHTGDSITVAPAQTISDRCLQQLRDAALAIGKAMGVVAGGANVQFAINPDDEDDIVVIEMNPRVSRSSALASKATGYPIAKISALLGIGFTLKDILNDITRSSPVSFEPTLDYVAVKIPLFPFDKFPISSPTLGPQMRSVGEVLGIGSNFNEAFMKALRSLELHLEIPCLSQLKGTKSSELTTEGLEKRLKEWHELSLLTVMEALRKNIPASQIQELSRISPWFIEQMNDLVELEKSLTMETLLNTESFLTFKKNGFSDRFMAKLLGIEEEFILKLRIENHIFPSYNAVDTCSGEFPAQTPYFYSTYGKNNEALPFRGKKPTDQSPPSIVILGSGPNRIGQGIEFDYSCVKAAEGLRKEKIKSIMVNSNPETVSTDYDCSDRLYLAPLNAEDLFDILYLENPDGVITSFSGQTGIHIRRQLESSFRQEYLPTRFLGPSWEAIERTEDREKFNVVLQKLPIQKTKSMNACGLEELLAANDKIGYPVIIRPSFVIGGESMFIFHNREEIQELPPRVQALLDSRKTSVLVENYLENAFEYDVDLVRDQKGNCLFTLCEHIEFAGVHSGDSGMITPPVHLPQDLFEKLRDVSMKMAEELEIVGPINFQFAVKEGQIYCIEANPRGSRTLPFLSKAYSLSLPYYAVRAMLGKTIPHWELQKLPLFCVKQSTFPFDRFLQDDSILGPKMRSTGETMGMDPDRDFAVLKSYMGNYPKIRKVGKILISLADKHKSLLTPYLKPLHHMGYQFFCTKGTYESIKRHGIPCVKVAKIGEAGKNILEVLKEGDFVMVFNTPTEQGQSRMDGEYIRNTATLTGIPCFTRPENIKAVVESLIGCQNHYTQPVCLQELPQCQF